ncbi:hypothetical protein P154DRAFT_519784 [Amniculicola lignicola CBS 123094]|uniref:Uncharacterized protein n=1 Tax=Amniculicola lignicola CBS 123094 TaxID=1392246 RepID=A0A6A5WPS8_9PLEO|nr:hypothetical protein P154DRAFT_519784 [Amniculicola lignicola CBS 123094]
MMDRPWIALYLCILIASAAVLYDQLTKRIPSRLRAEEAPKSAFGLVRADALSPHASAHGIDIIFVHGLGSNPDTTWGPKGTCWVSDFLPQDIPAAFHKDVRIFFYNYDSYWKRDAVQARLWSLGKSLLDRITLEIRGTEEEQTRNLVFVGHSYGGLVIKQALIQASTSQTFANVAEHTRAVFFLGTPHRGSSFSTWGSIAARALQPLGSNPLLLQEVVYDSLSLRDLHEGFENALSNKLQVVNFYEQRKTRILKLWFLQWEEWCVREQSATYSKVENIGLPVDHYGLNKFSSKNENYKIILGKLLQTITPIALQKQQRFYSVPVSTVESYTERYKLSAAVEEGLRVRHPKATVPYALAIYGLGGTGKTQLALKYVEDHRDEYNPILWIDAKDEDSVRSSFERCASELQLSVDRTQNQGSSLPDSLVVQAVLQWLRSRKETDDAWLVIVDNADDVSWGVKKVLPKGDRGSVIITSQDSQSRKLVDGGCEGVRVDTMEPLEARVLLLRHLDLVFGLVPGEILKDCDKIAGKLGYLALAVDLAGAYIGNDADQKSALRRYLADYEKHQDDLLQSEHFRGLSASDKTVWTVWDTTLKKIEERYAGVRPGLLLALLARFRGGIVQDEVFRLASLSISTIVSKLYDGVAELPEWLNKALASDGGEWDDFYCRQSRDVLIRYSLLQRTQGDWDGVRMHGLVQWRATKYEQASPWDRWHLLVITAACVQLSQEGGKPQFRRHMVTYIPTWNQEDLNRLGISEEMMPFIWSSAGRTYYDEGRWKEAEELFVQVMETSSRVLREEHPSTLTSMANLASTYRNQGRWKEAEELEVQVMEISSRVLREEYPDMLTSIANLASTYRNQGW